MKKTNYLRNIRAKVLSLIAKNISLNEEEFVKKYKTLLRLTNSQITLIFERIFDDDFYILIDILEQLDGNVNSRKMMEYILLYDDELLYSLKQLVCNDVFLYSENNVKILSGLSCIKCDNEQLKIVITKLNNILNILVKIEGKLNLDTTGYVSFLTEIIVSGEDVLQRLLQIEKQIYIEINNSDLIKEIRTNKSKRIVNVS